MKNYFLFYLYKEMSSVRSFLAQPKSRKFVNTQNNTTSSEWGPYWFPSGNVDTWYSNNSAALTKVSDTVYLVKDETNFASVLNDLDSTGTINERRTFTDMGKTLYIGNKYETAMIVLQLVQMFGPDEVGGKSGATGYIVIENNTRDAPQTGDGGRFKVRVARV